MKLNRKWINEEFVDLSQVSDKEFVETMTIAGQKVETYERLDAEIRNVVVGKVLTMVRHPNSDHMWICQVEVGQAEPVQIVTGAQNVHEGDLVPAALHNSWLPGGVHITKGKLRGEKSNGMLCSPEGAGPHPERLPLRHRRRHLDSGGGLPARRRHQHRHRQRRHRGGLRNHQQPAGLLLHHRSGPGGGRLPPPHAAP